MQKVARKRKISAQEVNADLAGRKLSGKTALKQRVAAGNLEIANRQETAEPPLNNPQIRSNRAIGQTRQESEDAVSDQKWKLTAARRKITDFFHPTWTTYYATREDAIRYFAENLANLREVRSVSLFSPSDIREDLKLDGIIIASQPNSSALPSKDGNWQIWDLTGPITHGDYSYASALATFTALWRSDPRTPDVFLVEVVDQEEIAGSRRKPRELWLKRRGGVVI